jgi:hypothetical protein
MRCGVEGVASLGVFGNSSICDERMLAGASPAGAVAGPREFYERRRQNHFAGKA